METCFKLRGHLFSSLSADKKKVVHLELTEYDNLYLDDPVKYTSAYGELLAQFASETAYAIGSVGAMVVGCSQRQSPTAGCMPECAGALRYPTETERHNSHCMQPVVILENNEMRVLTVGHEKETILMYVSSDHLQLAPRYLDVLYGLGESVKIINAQTNAVLYENVPLETLKHMVKPASYMRRHRLFFMIVFGLIFVLFFAILLTHTTRNK